MPYDTEYNKKIAKQILNANEAYIKRSNLTGSGLSGGFIEHLANALYEHHVKKFSGDGRSGGSGFASSYDASGGVEKSDGVVGGSMDYFRDQKRPPINAKPISFKPTESPMPEGSGQSGGGAGAMSRSIGGALGNGQHKYKKKSTSKLVKQMEMEGGNIFSDIADGFMSVVRPVAGVAKNILRVIPDPRAQAVGAVLDAVGAGKKKRGRPAKLSLIPKSEMHSSSMSGMGYSGGGSTGGGSTGGGYSGGGQSRNGRSVRASIVKDVMKKRGVSMIEASKIVKAEGLYSPK